MVAGYYLRQWNIPTEGERNAPLSRFYTGEVPAETIPDNSVWIF